MLRVRPARAVAALVIVTALAAGLSGQEPPPRFGGLYSALDARRQGLVDNWLSRFAEVTGQKIDPVTFYDNTIKITEKATFEAITHALMTTALTDTSGASLGDALGLIERIDGVRGKIVGAAGDRQFRMYVQLRATALETMARSQQFRRGADNTIFHKGYPINFRGTGGAPSIQISTALDRRHADVDVDYRSSAFPLVMFNGHLTASNSDIRAGNNYDRHTGRWSGFPNWWRGFFGIRTQDDGSGVDDEDARGRTAAGRQEAGGRDGRGFSDGLARRGRHQIGDQVRVAAGHGMPGDGKPGRGGVRSRHGANRPGAPVEGGAQRRRSSRIARRPGGRRSAVDARTQARDPTTPRAVRRLRGSGRCGGGVRM